MDHYTSNLFCRDQQGVELPELGRYATGIFYMDKTHHEESAGLFTALARECDLKVTFLHFLHKEQFTNSDRKLCTLKLLYKQTAKN
jgi:hypothetical protein